MSSVEYNEYSFSAEQIHSFRVFPCNSQNRPSLFGTLGRASPL